MPAPGSVPGTLPAPAGQPPPVVTRFVYDLDDCQSVNVDPSELEKALAHEPGKVVWVDVQGLGDGEIIRRIGAKLDLHALTQEGIVYAHQRPKLEEFDDHLFVIMRAVRLLTDRAIDNEQLSIILKAGLLVTFQERPGDGFDPVRRRLLDGKGPMRKSGADYLCYALIDTAIDNYYPVLDLYEDTMDLLDDQVRENPRPATSAAVHAMRRELRQLRRAVWPLREVASMLGRTDIDLITDPVRIAFRDCHDHAVQVADFVESNRERASDLADLYLAMVGEKTNQVMKVLTIIATIFIPLTFLCGLYGMNFDPEASPYNMPELKWRFGYPFFWIAVLLVFTGMLWFFRHKGWIGSAWGGRKKSDNEKS
ncbi:MAG TPA: magnesium/cobalt transporter CorA [Myxococcota bacterium]|nr:magnesium/cobalt transporter CorA [Myxococcota bacterium]